MPNHQTAYNYESPNIDPRFGVTDSPSDEFQTASGRVFAWFAERQDAERFARDTLCAIWDLNRGVKL